MLRCQPYRFQQLQHSRYCRQTTEKNSTESRLFVVVDHHLDPWRCVGIVPADRGVKRVLIVRRKRPEVGRLLVAFAPHSKRTQKKTKKNRKHLHSDKAQRHSLERRTEHYSRQSCAEQPKTTHHLYNEQPRHQSKQANRT